MKLTKISLFTLAAISCSGNSFAANDMELMPYLEATANTYLVPYLSRDLGKKVEVTAVPHQPKLKLIIQNASCDDYLSAAFRLQTLYPYEFLIDRLEEDSSLTNEQLYEPAKAGRMFQAASGLLSADIVSNPSVVVQCETTFKNAKESPVVAKISDEVLKLKPRFEKLKQSGRIKENLN